jgi:hypothetical protein
MKDFQPRKYKLWQLLMLPTIYTHTHGEAIQLWAIRCYPRKQLTDQITFNRLDAQPKAPTVTQCLAHASNAEASPKYAD